MNDFETGASRALERPGYAWRVGGCLLGLVAYGFALGMLFSSRMMTDPADAWQTMYVFILIGNVVAGSLFVYYTYCRALDCRFGEKGMAWIAAVFALPTVVLPQYGLLVFGVMMLFKSAPVYLETDDIAGDAEGLRPLDAAE